MPSGKKMPRPKTSRAEVQKLERLGVALLASRAFDALRGPQSRGAVPVEDIADATHLARTTVSRIAARELEREKATPFDLVARRVMDPDENQMQVGWNRAIVTFAEKMRTAGEAGEGASALDIALETISGVLAEEFEGGGSPERRQMLVTGYLLHAAALASASDSAASPALDAVLDWRRASYVKSSETYASALRLLLAQSGRRPKAPYTDAAIAITLHALFDGYMLLHMLDQHTYPLSLMRQAILDLGEAMTEPGLFAQRPEHNDPAPRIIQTALDSVKASHELVGPGEAAMLAGYPQEVGTEAFPDTQQFAERCIEAALRPQALALKELGAGVEQGAHAALLRMLETIEQLADDFRPLIDAAPAAPVWSEIEQLVADLLRRHHDPRSVPPDPRGAAGILVAEARRGSDGHNAWVAAIGMLSTGINPESASREDGNSRPHRHDPRGAPRASEVP